MEPWLIGVLGFVALFVLLAIGMHIAFAMTIVAFVGFAIITSFEGAVSMLATAPYSIVANYMFTVVPLFVLMGSLAYQGGLITDAYTSAQKWLGRLPGGLAMATIAGCAGFAACTGSSAASVSFMTMSTLPEMERHNYDQKLATGTIATGATLGILIPPSIPLIVYGLFASQSVGQLFIAGIIPGIVLATLFMITIYIWVKIKPSAGPRGAATTWQEKFYSLRYIWSMLVLAAIVLGGIWGGIFTPVEAGGIGSVGALLISLIRRKLTVKSFFESVKDTTRICGMVFIILIGAIMLNYFFALTRLPTMLATTVADSNLSPLVVLIAITVFYIIGGCLMDTFGLMMLTLPILIPIMHSLGIDMIMYGILMVLLIEMAQITPPIGLNVFILSGVARHIPMYTIFRGIVPFFFAILVMIILLIAFPQLATFLPATMMEGS
ncbi:MAG TPA: TRAP transporter large permease subunit [Dehalococcoidia bacterium]|nr:TRAP transporter large permease subunit [Dehalococcoidia bacterium]